MRVLIAFASRAGSTKEIAQFISEKLRDRGIEADAKDVSEVDNLGGYEAFVIGSAVYYFHWLKQARKFVTENRSILRGKPVWLFSSGPTGTGETDKKGRNLREVGTPKELNEIQESVNPRGHKVFFGAFFADRLKGAAGLFSRWVPKDEQGDFRNWQEIEVWANEIAIALSVQVTG